MTKQNLNLIILFAIVLLSICSINTAASENEQILVEVKIMTIDENIPLINQTTELPMTVPQKTFDDLEKTNGVELVSEPKIMTVPGGVPAF